MPFQRVRRALLVAASSALVVACGGGNEVVSQLRPTRVVAFGDAFSDVGQTGNRYTVNEGSAVNWTQQLASRYGVTLTAARLGGTSYATGNARVTAMPDAAGNAATPTIARQIDTFLAAGTLGANDLVLLSGGISDIVAQVRAVTLGTQSGAQARANVGAAGRELAAQAKRLVAAGGRAVVLVGPYNLGRAPVAALLGQGGLLTELSAEFNEQMLVSLVNEGRNILYVDAALYYNLVTGSPTSYSINNASGTACASRDPGPGIGIGTGQVNSYLCDRSTLQPGVDPATTLFADPIYFTTRGQQLFGDYAYDRVNQRF